LAALTLTRDDLFQEVGEYLGWGRTLAGYSAAQLADLAAYVGSGLRQFYYPTPVGGRAHRWTFLQPIVNLTLWKTQTATAAEVAAATKSYDAPTGKTTITMPGTWTGSFYESMIGRSTAFVTGGSFTITDYTSALVCKVSGNASAVTGIMTVAANGDYLLRSDFGGLAGDLTFDAETYQTPISVVGEGQIRIWRQRDSDSLNRPRMAATRPRVLTATAAQRYELCVYPTPNVNYAVSFRMSVLPAALAAAEHPYGADIHAETILASCMAVAERRKNDTAGIWAQQFAERLMASIARDEVMGAPDYFGRNGASRGGVARWTDSQYVTYKGVLYD
jgi:hypothetical protein